LAAPLVYVGLARVVRGEREPHVAVLAQEPAEVERAVAHVDLRVVEIGDANCEPPVWSAMPFAVSGRSCISPIAPDDDFAFGVELALAVDDRSEERRVEVVVLGVAVTMWSYSSG
jgi:hypothetical protein